MLLNDMTKTHLSLRPAYNIAFIILWGMASLLSLLLENHRVGIALAVVGGVFGAAAGIMQHLSFAQAADRFIAASSIMEVRRAFKATPWGSRYISWLYGFKLALIVIAYLLIGNHLLQILIGYIGGDVSLMLVRELVTLRDTIALHRIMQSSEPN
jgi:hypothetical protein